MFNDNVLHQQKEKRTTDRMVHSALQSTNC